MNGTTGSATAVAAGNHHSCAIQGGTGAVICWGNNSFGEATPPSSVNGTNGSASAITAAAQVSRSCAIQAGTAAVVCWGYHTSGEGARPPPADGTPGAPATVGLRRHGRQGEVRTRPETVL